MDSKKEGVEMSKLPKSVIEAWDDREGPIVLTTVDGDGLPNAIYATCVSKFSDEKLVVADNFFNKTRANIDAGCKASILFMTKEGKAYQVKGSICRETSGEIFDDMKKTWLNEKMPGVAAAVLSVEEVYSGSEKLL